MTKYFIMTRDWKGTFDSLPGKGWKVFATEDEIDTGQDCYAQIFYKGKLEKDKTGQDIYNIYERLMSEDVDGYINGIDENGYAEDEILIKV